MNEKWFEEVGEFMEKHGVYSKMPGDDGHQSAAFEVGKSLEDAMALLKVVEAQRDTAIKNTDEAIENWNKAQARIRELSAQLAAANARWEAATKGAEFVPLLDLEIAEADAAQLREALEKVEDYLCSEESPLYALWENGDICSWDDNPRERWSDVIDDMRNSKMSISDIGHGVEWQAVTVYRLVWAALADERQPESEEAK